MPLLTATVDPASRDVLAVANSPILWIFAIGVFVVILVQSFLYMRAARRAAPELGIERRELNQAFRAGAVASIGPSLAVVVVAVALLALFGTPAVLVRIGLIGSAGFETGAAQLAAKSMGTSLGAEGYTQQVFAVAFIAMSLGGAGWMIATLLMTPLLKRGTAKLSAVNPAVLTVIPAAAMLGAFAALALAEIPKSAEHAITMGVSAGTMLLLLLAARGLKAAWLKEWSLGIAILVGLTAAYLVERAA